ncbi:unnamed protein product [Haemonchus placei]|uniref:Uncharacterized protein n=1 Tax=Haemonchus placei TaxID=6290 RepID=A0A0N4WHY9_HAEPC|nr:unnamed protein product [Haemonchus placei]
MLAKSKEEFQKRPEMGESVNGERAPAEREEVSELRRVHGVNHRRSRRSHRKGLGLPILGEGSSCRW